MRIGDKVSLELWDRTTPKNKFGSGKVSSLEHEEWCESGFMVTVINDRGHTIKLDMNWLKCIGSDHDGSVFDL